MSEEAPIERKWNGEGKKICVKYVKTGDCKFREKCRYEHIQMCRYMTEGKKCFRQDCRFSHDKSEWCK